MDQPATALWMAADFDEDFDDAFAPTRPSGAVPLTVSDWNPSRPVRNADDLMVLARLNNRVCPQPEAWRALYALLPPLPDHGGRSVPAPVPLIGSAWQRLPPLRKRLRLRNQIEWAERAGCLPAVHQYLAALPESEWLHFWD